MSNLKALKALMIAATLSPTIVGFTGVMAQTPPPAFDRSADFGRFELVPGVFATEAEKQTLLQNGCVIGPAPLVARIVDKIGNTCDERMFKKLAGVHKSGSLLWMVTQTPVGLKVSLSDKVVNLGQNMQDGMVFPYRVYDHPFAGKPLLLQQTNSAGGGSVRAQIVAGVLASVLNGTGASAIAAATACRDCGSTFNVHGGSAAAEAGAISQQTQGQSLDSKSTTTVALPCSTGNCKP